MMFTTKHPSALMLIALFALALAFPAAAADNQNQQKERDPMTQSLTFPAAVSTETVTFALG